MEKMSRRIYNEAQERKRMATEDIRLQTMCIVEEEKKEFDTLISKNNKVCFVILLYFDLFYSIQLQLQLQLL
jgi:hypothetical protein